MKREKQLMEKAVALREKSEEMRVLKRSMLKSKRQNNTISESLNMEHEGDEPLIIVNGKVYHGNIKSISPDQIATMNVLKGKSAAQQYGVKHANGVIVINLKDLTNDINGWADASVYSYTTDDYFSSENIYITKNTTDMDLAAIKNEMKQKGIDFNYKRVRRNSNNEITGIKIDYNNGKGDKSVISKKSSTPIDDFIIEL